MEKYYCICRGCVQQPVKKSGTDTFTGTWIPEDFLTGYRMSIAYVGRPDCGQEANVISEQFHGPSNLDLDIEGKANVNVFQAFILLHLQ